MKRLTTDNPKDNLEAALNLFYIKDYETWVRGGGPEPEYADVSLFDFIRDVVKTHIPDVELPEDNDNLSFLMSEWLMDGNDSAEGVIALLYTAAWAYAELRHKLMRYEETGLEPEEIQNFISNKTCGDYNAAKIAAIEQANKELGVNLRMALEDMELLDACEICTWWNNGCTAPKDIKIGGSCFVWRRCAK